MKADALQIAACPPGSRRQHRWLLLGVAALAALGWARLRFEPELVVGSSMEPTLHSGDLLLLDRRAYRRALPARNDLVVVRHQGGRMVKRIVGLPGEDVEVRRSRLFIDARPIRSTHPVLPGYLDIGRGHLLPGRYAVLGDNRSLTPEETVHAVVGDSQILGRVVAAWSWRAGHGVRFQPNAPESTAPETARASAPGPGVSAVRTAGGWAGVVHFPRHGDKGEVPWRGRVGRWRAPPTFPLFRSPTIGERVVFTSFVSR